MALPALGAFLLMFASAAWLLSGRVDVSFSSCSAPPALRGPVVTTVDPPHRLALRAPGLNVTLDAWSLGAVAENTILHGKSFTKFTLPFVMNNHVRAVGTCGSVLPAPHVPVPGRFVFEATTLVRGRANVIACGWTPNTFGTANRKMHPERIVSEFRDMLETLVKVRTMWDYVIFLHTGLSVDITEKLRACGPFVVVKEVKLAPGRTWAGLSPSPSSRMMIIWHEWMLFDLYTVRNVLRILDHLASAYLMHGPGRRLSSPTC